MPPLEEHSQSERGPTPGSSAEQGRSLWHWPKHAAVHRICVWILSILVPTPSIARRPAFTAKTPWNHPNLLAARSTDWASCARNLGA